MTRHGLKQDLQEVQEYIEDGKSESVAVELTSHMDGPAFNIRGDGRLDLWDGSMFKLFEVAHKHGYIVSNVKQFGPDHSHGEKTKVYLRDADERIGQDEARAEGFLAGLFVGTTVALEDMLFGDITDLYPEVADDEDLFDGFADVDADAIIEELEDDEPF